MSFFTTHEIALFSPPGCGTCGLHKQCRSPRIGVTGGGARGILLLDSAPHAEEDEKGNHLLPPRADPLRKIISRMGFNYENDFWRMSAVACRLPRDAKPDESQIAACRPFVIQQIEKLKPRLIICLGDIAAKCVVGHSFPSLQNKLEVLRGYVIPDQLLGAYVCCTYDVDYINKPRVDPAVVRIWSHDVETYLYTAIEAPFPRYSWEGCVEVVTDTDRTITLLQKIRDRQCRIAFDYETTGLKPHARGHRILSVGIAVSPTKAFSFSIDNVEVRRAFAAVLSDPTVSKIAHNAMFEMVWSFCCVGEIRGRLWDTCILSHIDNCKRGVAGLDTQAYLRFGVPQWDANVSGAMRPKSKTEGGNSFNQLSALDFKSLGLYNGIDALVTYWLFDCLYERMLQC